MPPSPKGVTPADAHTILNFTLPMRSCREGPEHSRIPWIASAVVCQATHARLLPYYTPVHRRVDLRTGGLKASLIKRRCTLRVDRRTGGLRLGHPFCDCLGCSASKWWLTPKWERVECLSNRTGCSCAGSDQRSPRLVCAWLQIKDHQPHARTDCVDDAKLPQYTVFEKFATHNDGHAPPP